MRKATFRRVPVLAQGGAVQLNGKTGEVEATINGGERIFSRPDTDRIVALAKSGDDSALGKHVYEAIKKQDNRPQEYTTE
jgi:hypothetical protein